MAIGSPQWMYNSGSAYEIKQSLRFEDGNSAYLSKTFASNGNRRTWTWSGWVKRGNIGAVFTFFGAGNGGSQFDEARFNGANQLEWYTYQSASNGVRRTAQLFRDTSAWYHIVLVYDSTESTELDRMKVYVNGEQVTVFDGTTHPSQNHEGNINRNIIHSLGNVYAGQIYNPYDGYLGEVNFIDGAAKAPADFGETGDYGEWKPKAYSGSYGTNGFYLPFKQDYTVEGFSATTYTGNGTNLYVGGVGFQPDWVWIKDRGINDGATYNNVMYDAIRGVTVQLRSDSTQADGTQAGSLTAFNTDGFTLGSHVGQNTDAEAHIAWCWDMGGTTSTDHTQSNLTSVYRANTTYGQSVVTYTGDGAVGQGFAHGLGASPHFWMIKNRTDASDWYVYHQSLGNTKALNLNSTAAAATSAAWANYGPVSGAITVNGAGGTNTSGKNYVAYVFEEKTGYSKFGSYTGNGSTTGPTVTTGFKPAFVMIKSTAVEKWYMYDNTRNPVNPVNKVLQAHAADAEFVTGNKLDFNSANFQVLNNGATINTNGQTYIYMCFADKREYAYWLDQSGNNNDWTSNNLTESDISVDSPTNNFATFNALETSPAPNLSEGNLRSSQTTSHPTTSTMGMSSGKWYAEIYCESGVHTRVGICNQDGASQDFGGSAYSWCKINNSARVYHSGSAPAYGAEFDLGQICMMAFDADAGKIWYGVDGVWDASGNPATAANPSQSSIDGTDFFFGVASGSGTLVYKANFGQDSSFASAKAAQGNQDGNDIGDFFYAPPSGFLALCTSNLPDVAVIPNEHFNTVLYTGNNANNRAITGVGFAPDLVWVKSRPANSNHNISDSVRGNNKILFPNSTAGETTPNTISSLNSDGFTVGDGNGYDVNKNGESIVSWNWKAGGSSSSNSDGSITSTVSANVDAGFSIVGYTGNNVAGATIGHGLSAKPDLIIVKIRADNYTGRVYNSISGATKYLDWASTATLGTYQHMWNNTEPTSSVFSVGHDVTVGGYPIRDFIAYVFHSVEGYSKVGSYTGNGNANGTFVYTGFKPAYVLIKGSTVAENWNLYDSARTPVNDALDERLKPNSTAAEVTSDMIDFTSNGFKIRTTDGEINTSGATYIYLAFAETPFKHSNAR